MHKFNLFNKSSALYPLRWLIVFSIGMIGWMSYADITGWRLFSFDKQENWQAAGPGSHK